MTAGKTIALTIQTFVSKVMSLLFNMLSGLVIAFLPRSKCHVYSNFGAQENKICHCFHFSPSISHEEIEPDAMTLLFFNVEFQASSFTLLFHLHQEAL